jgi:hypothetical protein
MSGVTPLYLSAEVKSLVPINNRCAKHFNDLFARVLEGYFDYHVSFRGPQTDKRSGFA